MRKLKLQLDELKVESLVMDSHESRWGTVNGRGQAMPSGDGGCESDGCDTGGTNEQASFDYPCPTLNMLDSNCQNFTGVIACTIPTGVTCPQDCS